MIKAIINGKVITVTGKTYEKATVLVENGKITAVGPDLSVPQGAQIIDASGCWVTPGLIDCHTHICNFGEPGSMPGMSDGNEMSGPVQSHIRAMDAVYPDDFAVKEVRDAGFTTVYSTPGSGNVIGGTGISIKLRIDYRALKEYDSADKMKEGICMEVSLLLMEQIAQLFIVLLMGYIVVKAKLLKPSDSKVLSVVFVYLIMPCVVLNAFQIDDTPEIRARLLYSMAIAVGMHVVFLAFDTVIRRPLKLDAVERVNIIYSNAAALVIPLVQALLGSEYVVYSCAFVIVQLILLWTHASACLQGSTKLEWKKILTNVNLIAIVAGALLYLLHISLPAPIVSTLSSVGNMIGPMGMLLAGMAIAEVPLKKVFCTLRNYLPVVLRLLVVPVIVLSLLRVVHAAGWISDGKAILMTVYLSAITPSCATVTSMAQLYNRDAAHSSALYVLSTLLSIFTMPLMIGLFEVLI